MNIWIISDTHFNHLKLIEYEKRPKNFTDLIISRWNKLVQKDDFVIHLGDVILGHDSELPVIMSYLSGTKILVRGNHDHKSNEYYMKRGFSFVCDYYVYKNVAFSHAPLTPLPFQTVRNKEDNETSQDGYLLKPVDLNIHGHFHRGEHRGKSGMVDHFFNVSYYQTYKKKYHLIQIEDTFRPFLLKSILKIRGIIQ